MIIKNSYITYNKLFYPYIIFSAARNQTNNPFNIFKHLGVILLLSEVLA